MCMSCMCVCDQQCVNRAQRWMSSAIILPYSLELGSLPEPGARPGGQQVPALLSSFPPPPVLGLLAYIATPDFSHFCTQ